MATNNQLLADFATTNEWHKLHYYHQTPTFHDYDDEQQQLKLVNHDRIAQLSCDSGEMILRLNFSEAFKGIVYPDHNRLSPCRFFGDGRHNYELRLPLRGCGTRQVSSVSG